MPNGENKPTPDPTILTTEQLLREIQGLKEFLLSEVNAQTAICDEKFESVEKQFSLVESRRVEQKADTEKAVQAALSAAKEALGEQTAASDKSITKSETAMSEQVRQIGTTLTVAIKSTDDKVSSLSSRLDRIESSKQGGREQLLGIYALAGFLATILVIGGILATYLASH